jgi:hypothetical protein
LHPIIFNVYVFCVVCGVVIQAACGGDGVGAAFAPGLVLIVELEGGKL